LSWVLPVCNRTQADIENKTSKAYYNADDLNRIEQDCAYLACVFKVTITIRMWTHTDFPSASDFARILGNIAALRAVYLVHQSTPQTPVAPLNVWGKANDAEQILNDLYIIYEANQSEVLYTSEPCAGQMIGVI
jgi:hypothetical protein